MLEELIVALGLKKGAIIASLFGAVVSYRFYKELPRSDRIFTVLCAIPLAYYGGGGLGSAFGLSPETTLFVTFLLGAAGISFLSAVVKAAPDIIAAAKDYISRPRQ